jgi:putative membrane protein
MGGAAAPFAKEGPMKPFISSVAVLVVCCAGVNLAADKEVLSDKLFIAHAIDDGVNEVKFGQLAERLASNEKVKEFARKVVADHKKANKRLLELARAQKLAVVTDMKKDALAVYKSMSKLSKDEFDRAYMKRMVEDHKKAVSLFEDKSKNATDAEVKKFATDTLPTLREHLKTAQEILARL